MAKTYLQKIKEKVDSGVSYQKKYFKDRAERNTGLYQGYFISENQSDADKIPNNANLTYSTTRTIVSSVYAKNPSFQVMIMRDVSDFVDNLKLQGIDISKQAMETAFEFSLKLLIYNMDLHRTNRLAITDCVVQGFGVTKLGYKYEVDSALKEQFIQSASALNSNEMIKTNYPYILRCNPQNIILPSEASDPNKATWVNEKIYITKEDAKKQYKVDLKADYIPTYTSENDKANSMVLINEFHDFENNKIVVFSGNEKLDEKPYPLIDKDGNARSLYDFLWFNDSLAEIVYPTSDIDLVITQIIEANAQVERRINFNRKNTPKIFLNGSWEESAVRQIKEGEDLEVVINETGDGTVQNIPVQTLGSEFYVNIQSIKSEIYEILGITDYQVGGSTQQRKATEAQLIDRSRQDRVGERVRIIEEWHYSQVDKLVELIKSYQDIALVSKIEYEDKIIEVQLDKELFDTADVDIVIVPGSTVSVDKYEQDALLMQDIQMASLAPNVINAGELLRQYYKKRGYTNLEKIIPTQQPMSVDFGQLPGAQGQAGVPSATPEQQGVLPNTGAQ